MTLFLFSLYFRLTNLLFSFSFFSDHFPIYCLFIIPKTQIKLIKIKQKKRLKKNLLIILLQHSNLNKKTKQNLTNK